MSDNSSDERDDSTNLSVSVVDSVLSDDKNRSTQDFDFYLIDEKQQKEVSEFCVDSYSKEAEKVYDEMVNKIEARRNEIEGKKRSSEGWESSSNSVPRMSFKKTVFAIFPRIAKRKILNTGRFEAN